MRNKSQYKKNIVNLCILYLKYRNSYNLGFQKYSYFKNLMKYITNVNNNLFIRRVFDELNKMLLFDRKLVLGSVRYRFNPHKKIEDPNKKIILSFN